MRLVEGETAPLLKLEDSYGKTIDLAQLVQQGRYIVLWFYPKASSPGCTAQAKRYADFYDEFRRLGAEVFGVSADPAAAQCSFIDQVALKGAMIPDRSGAVGRAFGVGGWLGFGLLLGMYNRDTILINPEGKIEKIWRNVNPFQDAQIVLEYLKSKVGTSQIQPEPNPT
ncbi:peroxiredoxin [Meiothermus sp.]|uniref:peroxiredoxin n=1 Tax=Meiothermus sp. TaxID=1955249 RepID=UPI00307EF4CE